VSGLGIGLFFVHTVSVETFTGSGAFGESFAPPVTVTCYADDGNHLTRNKVGEEVVSQTIVFAPLQSAPSFTVDSRVTVNGRVATVISVSSREAGWLGVPAHVEVHLT
jgi:hypothetical protein